MGINSTSAVREKSTGEMSRAKEYNTKYFKGDKYKQRRKARKLISSKAVVSNSKNSARHKTGKLSPKENVKSTAKSAGTKKVAGTRRKNPCPNCKQWHSGKCPEPDYRPKKKQVKSHINEEYMASLFGS